MNRDIRYYKIKIKDMKRRHKRGAPRPNKIVLMLAVCERVAEMAKRGYKGTRMLTERHLIDLNPRLEALYYEQWNQNILIDSSQTVDHYFRTFGAMDEEPFWKLHLYEHGTPQDTFSEKNLTEHYEGAIVDGELIDILLDDNMRAEIQDLLLSVLLAEKKQMSFNTRDTIEETDNSIATLQSSDRNTDYNKEQQAFIEYMHNIGKAESSIKKYAIQAPNDMGVREIILQVSGQKSLYAVQDLEQAIEIHRIVKQSQFDDDGHNMYSVALHHYCNYLKLKNNTVNVPQQRLWTNDEMTLALDLYFQIDFREFSTSHPAIKELSELIQHSYKSVVERLYNYEYLNTGRGLSNGYGKCKLIWDKYICNRPQLSADVASIYIKIGYKPTWQTERKQPVEEPNSTKRRTWEPVEDWLLTEAFKVGEELSDSCVELLHRSQKSIIYRLEKLGLISMEKRDDLLRAYLAEAEAKQPVRKELLVSTASTVQDYQKLFQNMHRASGNNGKKAPHKVVLMLSILGVYKNKSERSIPSNIRMADIQLSFAENWRKYVNPSDDWTPNIGTPWEHMISEPFWHRCTDISKGYYLDENLQKLLIVDNSRKELRRTLLSML